MELKNFYSIPIRALQDNFNKILGFCLVFLKQGNKHKNKKELFFYLNNSPFLQVSKVVDLYKIIANL